MLARVLDRKWKAEGVRNGQREGRPLLNPKARKPMFECVCGGAQGPGKESRLESFL